MNLREKINIIEFASDPVLMNFQLLPTQVAVLKWIYQIPMDLEEKQTFRTIIGSSMPKWRGKEFQEIIFILGRQSSKSTLASIIAAYEACCNPWADYNKGSEMAWVFAISVREKHAIDIGRGKDFSKIHRSPHLRSLIVDSPSMAQRSEFPYSKTGVMVLKTGAAITALPCSAYVKSS